MKFSLYGPIGLVLKIHWRSDKFIRKKDKIPEIKKQKRKLTNEEYLSVSFLRENSN